METTNESFTNHLQKLAGSDFEMADGQPDIRGWDVFNSASEKLGDVEELLFDVAQRKVRYMIIDLTGNKLGMGERLVLVPIGLAELHEKDDEVILPNISVSQLQALHSYIDGDFDNDKEASVQAAFIGSAAAAGGTNYTMPVNQEFYDHENFNESNLYKRRKKDALSNDQNISKNEYSGSGIPESTKNGDFGMDNDLNNEAIDSHGMDDTALFPINEDLESNVTVGENGKNAWSEDKEPYLKREDKESGLQPGQNPIK